MYQEINTLTIFSNLKEDVVLAKLIELLQDKDSTSTTYISRYCDFVSELYKQNVNLSLYIQSRVLEDQNIYMERIAHKQEVPELFKVAVDEELSILERLSQITSEQLLQDIAYQGYLPTYEVESIDLHALYQERIQRVPKEGYGIFAEYKAFTIRNHELVGIQHVDPQRLEDLVGYEQERSKVIKNTLGFLEGMPSNNVLLYGDAGTGKSSTVKAILNEYAKDGLRLIEVKKHQMKDLPAIMETLTNNPLKFIIFIDDLSFSSNDDNFIAMKNILEGGINNAQSNVLVYATSNRRHFIKEDANERSGSELFVNDSIQETMSLAARFGLTITFQKPKKDVYMQIVQALAKRYGIQLSGQELINKAEAFAIRASGRSPRTAKQFIETQKIEESIEE